MYSFIFPLFSLSVSPFIAQITQWDLIFYGTETPAQPEDAVHISDGLFGNDMGHNDIEYDANLQWRNMQQVNRIVQ